MANSFTTQLLVDGPNNVVIKAEGVLDTSDLSATGTLGTAATGVITLNSKVITFTAGGLAPVVGQYVTSSGGTGTLASGSYIVSVDSSTQVTLNAAATASGSGATFTLVAGAVCVADPVLLSNFDVADEVTATKLKINKITYNIEDTISCNLFWDATTPKRIEELVGRGQMEYKGFGGLQNNAGAGVNGRITLSTQGWAATGVLSFTLILEMVKQ